LHLIEQVIKGLQDAVVAAADSPASTPVARKKVDVVGKQVSSEFAHAWDEI
jgi:hypothetical protein